jgi:2'-5' RNA ligase
MLVADRLGAFPSPARPRVLWLGLRGDVDRLERLVADVDARFGVTRPPTERFVAHITLGRVRQEAGEVPDAADVLRRIEPPARTMPADRLLLVRSELGRDGPTYTTIGEWPLGSVEPREHG